MQEETLRNIAADSMAQGFIVEILLARHLKSYSPSDREEIVSSILKSGQRIDHFFGVAKDDTTAEEFSDVVVKMHEALEGLVSRALTRIGHYTKPNEGEEPQS